MKDSDYYGEIRMERIIFASEKEYQDFLYKFFEVNTGNIDSINGEKHIYSKSGKKFMNLYSLEQLNNFKSLRLSVELDDKQFMVSIKGTGLQKKIYPLKSFISDLYEKNSIVSYYSWPSFNGDDDRATDKSWIYEQHERIRQHQNGVFGMIDQGLNEKVKQLIKSNEA